MSVCRIGLVARCDNSGLGVMSEDFYRHIPCSKVLLVSNGVYTNFPERFGKTKADILSIPTDDQMREFLKDLDVAVFIETPYNWNAMAIAHKMNVRTVLIPMYECLRPSQPRPDLYLCVSKLDFDLMSEDRRKFLNWPVDTQQIPWRHRTGKTVVHNAGHGGMLGRNGTDEVLKIAALMPDIKFIVRSQFKIACDLPNVDVRYGNVERHEDLWSEGDVFLFPHRFNGLSLPIQEAIASGMPAVSTDMYPFNQWLPKDFLLPVENRYDIVTSRRITASFIDVKASVEQLRKVLDRSAEMSELTKPIADSMSWSVLRLLYLSTFSSLKTR